MRCALVDPYGDAGRATSRDHDTPQLGDLINTPPRHLSGTLASEVHGDLGTYMLVAAGSFTPRN